MDESTIFLIQDKIESVAIGTTFDVKTLMGDDRASVKSKQSFGRGFKIALRDRKLNGLVHDHLANSPRRDIYKRVQRDD